jgi:beta-lactamase class A
MFIRSLTCSFLAAGLAAGVGCGSTVTPPTVSPAPHPGCAAPPISGVDTALAWTVALVVDDGRGTRVTLRADEQQPLASAVKVVHLAAYGRAVAEGWIHPGDPIRIRDWERWYLPRTDAGAHPRALDRAGIPNDGMRALDPQGTVPLDTIVASMIQVSDNSAADFLRDLLGDEALIRAAADGGWTNVDLPSFLGETLGLLAPELLPVSALRTQRAPAALALARRFTTDPAFRAELSARRLPPLEVQQRWADTTGTGSANQLAALHWAISSGAFGPGADIARRHLEWQKVLLPRVIGVGSKGGSLPGVLTEALTVRREDGSIATGILLVRRMSLADYAKALHSFAHRQMLLAALTNPAAETRLACCV